MFWTLLSYLTLHLLYGAMLHRIARKTACGPAYWAFLPALNFMLASRIAGFPLWTPALLLVPYFQTITTLALAAGLAYRLGHPLWTAAAALQPHLRFLLIVYFAFAKKQVPDLQELTIPPWLARIVEAAPAWLRTPAQAARAAAALATVGFVLGQAGSLWTGRPDAADPIRRTLGEFPVEPLGVNSARPVSFYSLDLRGPNIRIGVPADWFVDALTMEKAKKLGKALSIAAYADRPDRQVLVQVLDTGDKEDAFDQIASEMKSRGLPATAAGRPPYSGWRFVQGDSHIYVLQRKSPGFVAIVYSRDAAAHSLAAALSSKIGNGAGMFDYPQAERVIRAAGPGRPAIVEGVSLEGFYCTLRQHIPGDPSAASRGIFGSINAWASPDRSAEVCYGAGKRKWTAILTGFDGILRAPVVSRGYLALMEEVDKDESSVFFAKIRALGVAEENRIQETYFRTRDGFGVVNGPAGATLVRITAALRE